MSLILNRRFHLGKGTFLNVSRSGFSASQRFSWGSIGTRGFTIRSGIPGVTFRKRYKKNDPVDAILALFVAACLIVIPVAWAFILVVIYVCIVAFQVAFFVATFLVQTLWEIVKWLYGTVCDNIIEWRERRKKPNQALQTTPMTRSVFEKTEGFEDQSRGV